MRRIEVPLRSLVVRPAPSDAWRATILGGACCCSRDRGCWRVAPTTDRWDVPCRVGGNRYFFYASVFRDSTVPTGLPSDVSLRCLALVDSVFADSAALAQNLTFVGTAPWRSPSFPAALRRPSLFRVCSGLANAGPPPHTAGAPGLSALKARGPRYLRRPRLAIKVRYRRTSSLFRKASRRRRRPTNFIRERRDW